MKGGSKTAGILHLQLARGNKKKPNSLYFRVYTMYNIAAALASWYHRTLFQRNSSITRLSIAPNTVNQ